MKVVNIVGFDFTLPPHLCPNNIPLTIPFDGRIYNIPDKVYFEDGLINMFKVIERPQPQIINIPVAQTKIIEKQPEIKYSEITGKPLKKRGPRFKKEKVLGNVELKDDIRKSKKRNRINRFDYIGSTSASTVQFDDCKEMPEMPEIPNVDIF
jgi:hypothetical protein